MRGRIFATIVLMQPNQPQPNPYDFIMNGSPQAPKSRIPFSGNTNSTKSKIMIFVGSIVVLIIVGILLMSILGGSKDSTQQLVSIAQEQEEIVRIANLATGKARTQAAVNLSASTAISVSSTQKQIIGLIGKKAKVDAKKLALKKDLKTDQALTVADQNNNFDEVFTQTLQTELTDYQANLKKAYDTTSNKKSKAVLLTGFNGVDTLIGAQTTQLPAAN